MVHQRQFWGNTRGLSEDLGWRLKKQVEKTHSNRLTKYHAERRCQKRWGRLPIQEPFRCKRRVEPSETSGPGHQGPRVGVSYPGHDRWGRLAIRGPFRCQHRIKHRKRRAWPPGSQGGRQLARPRPLGPACHPGAFPVQAPDKAPETSTWSPGSQGGHSLPGHDRWGRLEYRDLAGASTG